MGNLGAQKAKRNDTPISAKKDIMGDKTVRVRADLHHIIKTVKESLQIIDEIAKQKISSGWCRDRAHFFKTYGFEGEYWGSYMGRFEKLEPGIYKVVVVGVDAKTGEYNSVVAFSEPFKTEEY